MTFASMEERNAIEQEMPWADRDVATTFYDFLTRVMDKFPDRPAVSYQLTSGPKDKAETLTWADLHRQSVQAANLFRDLGINEGDSVAYVLPNANETLFALFGGMIAGVANPINPLLDPEQIASILRETGAKVVVTLKAFPKTDVPQKVAEAVALAPDVHTVLEVDLLRYLTPPKSWIVPLIRPKNPVRHKAKVLDFRAEMAKQPVTLSFDDSTGNRVGAYFHTGGTTGMPKVAQHCYEGMVYNGWIGQRLLFDENDTIMCPLPLFHVFAVQVIMMSAIASGAHVVFPTPQGYRGEGVFDNFWKLIERWNITFIITVPTAVSALMQRPVNADISSVEVAFSGSAPMPIELFKRFEKASDITIVEGYGLTEATCLVSCNPVDGKKKVGSVGIPFPHTEVKIVAQTDEGPAECKTDEVGEICIASPGVYVGSTYTDVLNNKDLYYQDRFLRTGDLGRVDADGYVWITGRAKDLIIRGGHNIDPAEIEEALVLHPAVAMAGVIGQPDKHSGELPCAYVELVEGASATAEELMAHAKTHVHERAAQPKHVEVLDELPKTAVGKVFKPDLRKRAITRVYDAALAEAGLDVQVSEVIDDKRRGLVAQLSGDKSREAAVAEVLGNFTRPWEWSGDAV
ncbi:acyl-CoA synthetase [Cognatishimia maritima]|uniref:Long-chain acyl-CoA synthetase n=1 Tax=Cognatishimia maritima TaxID=870908 RepID=A0A1M5JYJ2_9RHOB|nr:acyl-CoA synthetase [Cognatishimia maritima]SHG45319.1 long-chain acyl-CoA synthetase [Cognatishimia maritima]